MGSVVIEREVRRRVDRLRAYKVVIDGEVVGRIKQRQTVRFPVAPGRHEVFLKIDWTRSSRAVVDVAAGGEARLRCGPSLADDMWKRPWKAWRAITAGRKEYVRLTAPGDGDPHDAVGISVSP